MARILITGAARGIGRGTAIALTERGHEVIATARDAASLADVPAAVRLSLDVTDQASVDGAIARAGRVDVLVSNAGATVRAPLETVPLEEVQRIIEVNTLGSLRVAQAVLPGMRAQGSGQILFLSSIQGRLVLPLIGTYAISKWGLEAMAETLAVETGHFGISVHVLQPGAVASGGAERAPVYIDDANPYRPLLGKIAAFRAAPISVEEVAEAIAETVDQGGQGGLQDPGRRSGDEDLGRPQGRAREHAVPGRLAGLVAARHGRPPDRANPQAKPAASAPCRGSRLADGSARVGRLEARPARPDGGPCPGSRCERRTTQDSAISSVASSAAATNPVTPTSTTPTTAGTPLDWASTSVAEAMLGAAPTAPTRAAVLKLSARSGSRASSSDSSAPATRGGTSEVSAARSA